MHVCTYASTRMHAHTHTHALQEKAGAKKQAPMVTPKATFLFFNHRELVVLHASFQKLTVKNGGACRMKPILHLVSSSDVAMQLGDFHRSLTLSLSVSAC